jgi:hypothetical protein
LLFKLYVVFAWIMVSETLWTQSKLCTMNASSTGLRLLFYFWQMTIDIITSYSVAVQMAFSAMELGNLLNFSLIHLKNHYYCKYYLDRAIVPKWGSFSSLLPYQKRVSCTRPQFFFFLSGFSRSFGFLFFESCYCHWRLSFFFNLYFNKIIIFKTYKLYFTRLRNYI